MVILQMDLENKSPPLSLVPPLPSRAATAPHTSRPSAPAQRGAFVDHARSVGSDGAGATSRGTLPSVRRLRGASLSFLPSSPSLTTPGIQLQPRLPTTIACCHGNPKGTESLWHLAMDHHLTQLWKSFDINKKSLNDTQTECRLIVCCSVQRVIP